jgi:hypothetical protein
MLTWRPGYCVLSQGTTSCVLYAPFATSEVVLLSSGENVPVPDFDPVVRTTERWLDVLGGSSK